MHIAGTAAKRVNITWNDPQDWDQIQRILALLLQYCEQVLAQHNATWLGHCKALVQADGGAAYGSITGAGEPLSWRGTLPEPVSETTITLYCVVYAVPEDLVVATVEAALNRYLPDAIVTPAPQPSQTLELI